MTEFIKAQKVQGLRYECVELECESFSLVRRVTRKLITVLQEVEQPDIADHLKINLFKTLYTPTNNWDEIFEDIPLFDSEFRMKRTHGDEFLDLYHHARDELDAVKQYGSILYSEFCKYINEICNFDFRIFCHRRERDCYEELLAEVIPYADTERLFLHNLTDYRNSAPFDILIRVGSIRSFGWSAIPNMLIRTPKYKLLKQFVWKGGLNDEGAFVNPVDLIGSIFSLEPALPLYDWYTKITNVTSSIPPPEIELSTELPELEDELIALNRGNIKGSIPAISLEFDCHRAVLFRLGAEIHIWNSREIIFSKSLIKIKAEELENEINENCYFIVTDMKNVDVGDVNVEISPFADKWQQVLSMKDTYALAKRLKSLNLNWGWSLPNDSVIHAPQRKEHFFILLNGLKNELSSRFSIAELEFTKWCKLAWSEISRSRGRANLHGKVKKEIFDESLISVLSSRKDEINDKCALGQMFRLRITSQEIKGILSFYPIIATESNFLVPENKLEEFMPLHVRENMRL